MNEINTNGPRHCGFCQSAPCQCPHNDSDIPRDLADEMFRAASASGRIRYEWLCGIYRKGRAAALEREAQQAEARATPREGLAHLAALRTVAQDLRDDAAAGVYPEASLKQAEAVEWAMAALRAPAEAPQAAQVERREAHETLAFDVENAFRDLVKAMRAPREGYDPMPWVATALAHCKHALAALSAPKGED